MGGNATPLVPVVQVSHINDTFLDKIVQNATIMPLQPSVCFAIVDVLEKCHELIISYIAILITKQKVQMINHRCKSQERMYNNKGIIGLQPILCQFMKWHREYLTGSISFARIGLLTKIRIISYNIIRYNIILNKDYY